MIWFVFLYRWSLIYRLKMWPSIFVQGCPIAKCTGSTFLFDSLCCFIGVNWLMALIFARDSQIENCVGSLLLTWIIVFLAWLFSDWWCGAVFCGDAERQFFLVPFCWFYSLCLFYRCLMIDEGILIFVLWCPKANCARLPLWILSILLISVFIDKRWNVQFVSCDA